MGGIGCYRRVTGDAVTNPDFEIGDHRVVAEEVLLSHPPGSGGRREKGPLVAFAQLRRAIRTRGQG